LGGFQWFNKKPSACFKTGGYFFGYLAVVALRLDFLSNNSDLTQSVGFNVATATGLVCLFVFPTNPI
jgi:hypothetical protein